MYIYWWWFFPVIPECKSARSHAKLNKNFMPIFCLFICTPHYITYYNLPLVFHKETFTKVLSHLDNINKTNYLLSQLSSRIKPGDGGKTNGFPTELKLFDSNNEPHSDDYKSRFAFLPKSRFHTYLGLSEGLFSLSCFV